MKIHLHKHAENPILIPREIACSLKQVVSMKKEEFLLALREMWG